MIAGNASSSSVRSSGFGHIGVQVADLNRSVAFYRDLLGLELVARSEHSDDYLGVLLGYPGVTLDVAVLRLPFTDACLELMEYKNVEKHAIDPSTANPATGHLCLYVDDLDAAYDALRASEVSFISSPQCSLYGPEPRSKLVYLLDPDGFRVELVETQLTLAGDPRARP